MPQLRFIPAGAGNTTTTASVLNLAAVHPRWRGEHYSPRRAIIACIGSSPLARGTPKLPKFQVDVIRFIPAGAGNTKARFIPVMTSTVHPRWRGEHGAVASNALKHAVHPRWRGEHME